MEYNDFNFKIPIEAKDYSICSFFIIKQIEKIISTRIFENKNKIIINTNLHLGLPMENINKIAGPFVEAWAYEVFFDEMQNNRYQLINVETLSRLNISDIILQFKKPRKIGTSITAGVDVKATSEDIKDSGKSPNITSYARIRTAYVEDPDYIFIILSLKHKVYSEKNNTSFLMDGIMEIVGYNIYDLKYLSESDISYNPSLGTGQIQIKDIHYVDQEKRTTWEFCRMLDKKYLKSSKRDINQWEKLAVKYKWIK